MLVLWGCIAVAMLVCACQQATTLGGKAPDTVTITGTPTWSNGIGQLMALKCAVCHQQPLPDVAPNNTPTDMAFTQFASQGTLRGAQDAVSAIQAGILQHTLTFAPGQPIILQMPLDFATPLVPSEEAALETWASTSLFPTSGTGTAAADGLPLYAAYCQGCHGVAGGGGVAQAIAGSPSAFITTELTAVPEMSGWPGLSSLTSDNVQAIAAYLASP
jgi:mono/diheme cytochrome c family protein